MAYFTGNIPTPTDGFNLRVDYTYTQEVNANRTIIETITGKVKRTSSSYYPSNSSKVATLKIERQNDSGSWVTVTTLSKSSSYSISSDNYYTWVSDSDINIAHKSDGTQNLRLTFSVDGKLSSYYPIGNISKTIKLPDLHTPPEITGYTIEELNVDILGVPNNVFVNILSQKRFTINANFFDDAVASEYRVLNGTYITSSISNSFVIDYKDTYLNPWSVDPTKVIFSTQVIDSKGGIDKYPSTYDIYDYIPYFIPTFNETNTNAKRDGQTSGKVNLNVLGNYYSSNIGDVTQSIKVYYKVWEKGTTEPTTGVEIPDENIIKVNNTFQVVDFPIGNTDPLASNYFDYKKAYNVKFWVQDSFKSYVSPSIKSIPVGEATWTEYADRVDFKKLTISGKDINEVVLYDNSTGTSGDVTLSESAENFKYLEIFFRHGAGNTAYSSLKVYQPNSKSVDFYLSYDNGTYLYVYSENPTISANTIIRNIQLRWRYSVGAASYTASIITRTEGNVIYITRVVGYR